MNHITNPNLYKKITDLMTRYEVNMQKELHNVEKLKTERTSRRAEIKKLKAEIKKLKEDIREEKRQFKDYKAYHISELSNIGKKQLEEHFNDFIDNRIEYDPQYEKGMSIHKIYDIYRDWCRDFNADEQPKRRKWLQTYLDKKYGKKHNCIGETGYSCLKLIGAVNTYDEVYELDELDE